MATTGGKRNNLPHSYTHLSVLARNIIILMKLARVSDKSRRSIPHMPKPTPSAWPEVVPDAWLTKRGGQLAKYFPWLTRPALAILDFFGFSQWSYDSDSNSNSESKSDSCSHEPRSEMMSMLCGQPRVLGAETSHILVLLAWPKIHCIIGGGADHISRRLATRCCRPF